MKVVDERIYAAAREILAVSSRLLQTGTRGSIRARSRSSAAENDFCVATKVATNKMARPREVADAQSGAGKSGVKHGEGGSQQGEHIPPAAWTAINGDGCRCRMPA